MRLPTVVCLTLLVAVPARAQAVVDDSDLAGRPSPAAVPLLRAEGQVLDGVRVFRAESAGGARFGIFPTEPAGVIGRLMLTDPQGREVPARMVKVLLAGAGAASETETDAIGEFFLRIPAGATGQAQVRFRLENARWSITDPDSGKPYEWEAGAVQLPANRPIPLGTFRLDPNAANGKIGYIHLQFLEAMDLFARERVAMDWWKKRLRVVYPSDGDYFMSWGFTLNLTRAEAWDVNLHELGHAVMDLGTRSHGGGGQHKIDECYNEGLAWSEGWATFFAAAVRLGRDDADAKFEYLVPRRAPIRIENVPDDVCRGDKNEWRVASGLWDIYDTHADGRDSGAVGFARVWSAIRDQSMGGFGDAWGFLRKALTPQELAAAQAALEQDTLSAPGAVARGRWWRWPWEGRKGLEGLAAPDFDGRFRQR